MSPPTVYQPCMNAQHSVHANNWLVHMKILHSGDGLKVHTAEDAFPILTAVKVLVPICNEVVF